MSSDVILSACRCPEGRGAWSRANSRAGNVYLQDMKAVPPYTAETGALSSLERGDRVVAVSARIFLPSQVNRCVDLSHRGSPLS